MNIANEKTRKRISNTAPSPSLTLHPAHIHLCRNVCCRTIHYDRNWKLCMRKIFTNLFVNVNMLGFFPDIYCHRSIYRFAGFNLCWTYGNITSATSAFYIDLRTTTSIKHETTGTNNIRSSKFFGRLSRFAGNPRRVSEWVCEEKEIENS